MLLSDRVAATEKTLAKYKGKPFAWGVHDCAKLAYTHLRNMGHRPAAMASYRSATGARTALKKYGAASLEQVFDAMLPRIAPAAALVGDLVMLPGDDPLGAVFVCVGNGRVMGWHEDAAEAVIMQPKLFVAGWRCG